tara:strand:- start:23083 stop:23250 length:168 start_codon:yes stop_codon:yes gene_type:complete
MDELKDLSTAELKIERDDLRESIEMTQAEDSRDWRFALHHVEEELNRRKELQKTS